MPPHNIAREKEEIAKKEAEEARQLKERQNQYYAQEAKRNANRIANQTARRATMGYNRGHNLGILQKRINTSLKGINNQGSNPGLLGNSYINNYRKTISNARFLMYLY
jgi:hypothetical protein